MHGGGNAKKVPQHFQGRKILQRDREKPIMGAEGGGVGRNGTWIPKGGKPSVKQFLIRYNVAQN